MVLTTFLIRSGSRIDVIFEALTATKLGFTMRSLPAKSARSFKRLKPILFQPRQNPPEKKKRKIITGAKIMQETIENYVDS